MKDSGLEIEDSGWRRMALCKIFVVVEFHAAGKLIDGF
jgi:hypothetical protein